MSWHNRDSNVNIRSMSLISHGDCVLLNYPSTPKVSIIDENTETNQSKLVYCFHASGKVPARASSWRTRSDRIFLSRHRNLNYFFSLLCICLVSPRNGREREKKERRKRPSRVYIYADYSSDKQKKNRINGNDIKLTIRLSNKSVFCKWVQVKLKSTIMCTQ